MLCQAVYLILSIGNFLFNFFPIYSVKSTIGTTMSKLKRNTYKTAKIAAVFLNA